MSQDPSYVIKYVTLRFPSISDWLMNSTQQQGVCVCWEILRNKSEYEEKDGKDQ